MKPQSLLRLEGVAVFVLSMLAYLQMGWSIWLLVLLAFVPDLSLIGYVSGPKIGAKVYNAVHTYVGPLVLGGAGVWLGVEAAILVGIVWIAHIGADRALGYGLKHEQGFHETHLGWIGPPKE